VVLNLRGILFEVLEDILSDGVVNVFHEAVTTTPCFDLTTLEFSALPEQLPKVLCSDV